MAAKTRTTNSQSGQHLPSLRYLSDDRHTLVNVAYTNRELHAMIMNQVSLPWPVDVPFPFQKQENYTGRESYALFRTVSNGKSGAMGYIAIVYERSRPSTRLSQSVIQVWNCQRGYTSQCELRRDDPLKDISFSPAIPYLLITCHHHNRSACLWDSRYNKFQLVHRLDVQGGQQNIPPRVSCAFTPQGQPMLVSFDKN